MPFLVMETMIPKWRKVTKKRESFFQQPMKDPYLMMAMMTMMTMTTMMMMMMMMMMTMKPGETKGRL